MRWLWALQWINTNRWIAGQHSGSVRQLYDFSRILSAWFGFELIVITPITVMYWVLMGRRLAKFRVWKGIPWSQRAGLSWKAGNIPDLFAVWPVWSPDFLMEKGPDQSSSLFPLSAARVQRVWGGGEQMKGLDGFLYSRSQVNLQRGGFWKGSSLPEHVEIWQIHLRCGTAPGKQGQSQESTLAVFSKFSCLNSP